jgi:hypothetical protein
LSHFCSFVQVRSQAARLDGNPEVPQTGSRVVVSAILPQPEQDVLFLDVHSSGQNAPSMQPVVFAQIIGQEVPDASVCASTIRQDEKSENGNDPELACFSMQHAHLPVSSEEGMSRSHKLGNACLSGSEAAHVPGSSARVKLQVAPFGAAQGRFEDAGNVAGDTAHVRAVHAAEGVDGQVATHAASTYGLDEVPLVDASAPVCMESVHSRGAAIERPRWMGTNAQAVCFGLKGVEVLEQRSGRDQATNATVASPTGVACGSNPVNGHCDLPHLAHALGTAATALKPRVAADWTHPRQTVPTATPEVGQYRTPCGALLDVEQVQGLALDVGNAAACLCDTDSPFGDATSALVTSMLKPSLAADPEACASACREAVVTGESVCIRAREQRVPMLPEGAESAARCLDSISAASPAVIEKGCSSYSGTDSARYFAASLAGLDAPQAPGIPSSNVPRPHDQYAPDVPATVAHQQLPTRDVPVAAAQQLAPEVGLDCKPLIIPVSSSFNQGIACCSASKPRVQPTWKITSDACSVLGPPASNPCQAEAMSVANDMFEELIQLMSVPTPPVDQRASVAERLPQDPKTDFSIGKAATACSHVTMDTSPCAGPEEEGTWPLCLEDDNADHGLDRNDETVSQIAASATAPRDPLARDTQGPTTDPLPQSGPGMVHSEDPQQEESTNDEAGSAFSELLRLVMLNEARPCVASPTQRGTDELIPTGIQSQDACTAGSTSSYPQAVDDFFSKELVATSTRHGHTSSSRALSPCSKNQGLATEHYALSKSTLPPADTTSTTQGLNDLRTFLERKNQQANATQDCAMAQFQLESRPISTCASSSEKTQTPLEGLFRCYENSTLKRDIAWILDKNKTAGAGVVLLWMCEEVEAIQGRVTAADKGCAHGTCTEVSVQGCSASWYT